MFVADVMLERAWTSKKFLTRLLHKGIYYFIMEFDKSVKVLEIFSLIFQGLGKWFQS